MVILEKQVVGLSERALGRFVLRARKAVGLKGLVNVLVTGSSAMRVLNRQFRSQNKPTDVLSFPAITSNSQCKAPRLAGDVAISADIALQNSLRFGHPSAQEVKILALHGILHLAGFDHERDNGEMEREEARMRRVLGLPTALIERGKIERGKTEPGKTERVHSERAVHRTSSLHHSRKRSTPVRRIA